jgi:hypothetical protein
MVVPESSFNKTRFFTIFGLVVFLASAASYYALRSPSPLVQARKFSSFELPAGTKGILWRTDEDGHHGLFELPKEAIPKFIERYELKPDPILTYSFSETRERCSPEGKGEGIGLNNETGELELSIGNEPCKATL